MTQTSTDNRKSKLQKYGVLVAYSLMGMIGLGLFSFKIIMTRQGNMEKHKTKSRLPIMHKEMKNLALGGILGTIIYSYGLWEIMRRAPKSDTNIEMADYSQLTDVNRKNPQMQDHYIIKTMKMFGVSENLIEKTKQQFKEMGQNENEASMENKSSLNSQFWWALLKRKKLQVQHNKNQQNVAQ